jgi:electron transfer flavoprotein alpha subunit
MILFIEFQPGEAAAAAGFAAALGDQFDVLAMHPLAHGPAGAGKSESLGLSDIPTADAIVSFLERRIGPYTKIAAVSSMASKDVLARLAGALDAPMVTDAIGFRAPNRFKRPVAAGNAIAVVEVAASPVVVTFRPSGFPGDQTLSSAVTGITFSGSSSVTRLSASAAKGGRPDLAQAKVVVSGGRPLKDAATFESIIGGLADALGGAVGATRAAVDSGIAPNELQVGQTGKVVAPGLYIAAGISGSTQHLAGIKDSKVIVAINTDPDAPIFEAADFGLVADLYQAVPELTEKVRR